MVVHTLVFTISNLARGKVYSKTYINLSVLTLLRKQQNIFT